MQSYLDLSTYIRTYSNKNIFTTLNPKSLESFQISEKIDLPFFVIYWLNNKLNFSYSLAGPKFDSVLNKYVDTRLIEDNKFVINRDLHTACSTLEKYITDDILQIFKLYEGKTLQIYYIPESTSQPFTTNYASLKNCGYSYIISENYKQSKTFTTELIKRFNNVCPEGVKIAYNPYYYTNIKKSIREFSSVIKFDDSPILNGSRLDDEIYKALKKSILDIQFPLNLLCPEQKPLSVYLTFDRGRDFKTNGYSKRFTYAFFPLEDNIEDKVTNSLVEDNVSRLPYELLIVNFGTYIAQHKDRIPEITKTSNSYIEASLQIIEDYCTKTNFSFITNLGLSSFDLRPPKLRHYMSPINIEYISEKFNLSKSYITQLKHSDLLTAVTCTLLNFLFIGINNDVWTIYLDASIKSNLKRTFNLLRNTKSK